MAEYTFVVYKLYCLNTFSLEIPDECDGPIDQLQPRTTICLRSLENCYMEQVKLPYSVESRNSFPRE